MFGGLPPIKKKSTKISYIIYHIDRNFHQEKNSPISPFALIGECSSTNFLSCVNYTEYMATFTALVKKISTKYFCNAKVAGLGELFVKQKFRLYSTIVSHSRDA